MEKIDGEVKLDLMSFDLGEQAGGVQTILAYRSISPTEHFVFTVGDGVKEQQQAPVANSSQEPTGVKKFLSKQTLMNLRNHFIKPKDSVENNKENENNTKLRCFKLKFVENQKYSVEEYVTADGINEVAKMMGFGKDESNLTK